jgi:hypothetical protein
MSTATSSPALKLTATQNAPESEKAQRYLEQLDEARCAGRWPDVPELCRKVEKHAPHRKCLRCAPAGGLRANGASRPHTHSAL